MFETPQKPYDFFFVLSACNSKMLMLILLCIFFCLKYNAYICQHKRLFRMLCLLFLLLKALKTLLLKIRALVMTYMMLINLKKVY